MNDSKFHDCIDAAWAESEGDWKLHHQVIQQNLMHWSLPELVEFHVTQLRLAREAFTPTVYNAAFMIWDGALGMDGFLDFTDALSVTPRTTFETIIMDPDYLIEISPLWTPSQECFWLIPFEVLDAQNKVKKGSHLLEEYLPPDDTVASDLWAPLKGAISRETSEKLLPKLFSRFGEYAFSGR